ncbi:COG3650 family protein [Novosphingobium panipatense]|uniref:Lipoprotein n=1 Tax=Novosphingobium panipatense TaxID=428991 RepID=A0ABY1Q7V5_9SPHN|nr:hypothetical protein [Novosphingobium panipatense]SMP62194.1 hypothetical protein SAMN06296065_103419 [Novosphingobium panipatense]
MSRLTSLTLPSLAGFFALAACHSATDNLPGDAGDHRPWNGIKPGEIIQLVGTEPFWGGTVGAEGFRYTTPENPEGVQVPVARFAGRGGVSFSGSIGGREVILAVTPTRCSDGMSDTVYPFAVTLQMGEQLRQGCAWTDREPRLGAAR